LVVVSRRNLLHRLNFSISHVYDPIIQLRITILRAKKQRYVFLQNNIISFIIWTRPVMILVEITLKIAGKCFSFV